MSRPRTDGIGRDKRVPPCAWRLVLFGCAMAASVSAATVAVTPGTLVEVSFVAAVEKGPAVEDDPALAELLPISTGRPAKTAAKFASAEWRFLDAARKRVPRPRISFDRFTLFSRRPRTFSFRVYVPERAVAVEVSPSVLTDGDAVQIGKLAAKVVPRGEILNLNPDFTTDDRALPNWQLAGAARFGTDGEGRPCAILEDGDLYGDLFPVTGGKRLSVALQAAPPRFATKKHIPWGAIHFYDRYEDGAKKEQPFARPKLNVRSTARGEATETYPIPPSAKWCRIVVRVGTVYRCTAKER